MTVGVIVLAAGPDPDNEQARRWLVDELGKARYRSPNPVWSNVSRTGYLTRSRH